jgi:hypothetical protein
MSPPLPPNIIATFADTILKIMHPPLAPNIIATFADTIR